MIFYLNLFTIFILILVPIHSNIDYQSGDELITKSKITEVNVVSLLNNCEWIGNVPKLEDNSIIILDFWATWCAPCIQSFPHINKLTEKFSNDSISFICITNEKRKIVQSFLKNHKLYSFVALDSSKKLHEFFNINSIPITYIINKSHHIIWKGHPAFLTDSILKYVILKDINIKKDKNTKIIDKEVEIENERENSYNEFNNISFSLLPTVSKTASNSQSIDFLDSGIVCRFNNRSLCEIIIELFNLNSIRTDCIIKNDIQWDFHAFLPNSSDIFGAKNIWGEMVLTSCMLMIDTVEIETDLNILTCIDSTVLENNRVSSLEYNYLQHVSTTDSMFLSANISINTLCKNIENIFHVYCDSEIQSDTRYNFQFSLTDGLPGLTKVLANDYGLTLNKKNQKINIIRIKNKE